MKKNDNKRYFSYFFISQTGNDTNKGSRMGLPSNSKLRKYCEVCLDNKERG